jgi:hypothetical protein
VDDKCGTDKRLCEERERESEERIVKIEREVKNSKRKDVEAAKGQKPEFLTVTNDWTKVRVKGEIGGEIK